MAKERTVKLERDEDLIICLPSGARFAVYVGETPTGEVFLSVEPQEQGFRIIVHPLAANVVGLIASDS